MNREVVAAAGGAGGALAQLDGGPTDQEEAELGLTTAMPETGGYSMSLSGGVARVELDLELPPEGLAQLVYTLTQLPTGTGTRGTFEFTVPFEVEGDGTLIVFESSAKDGSRINVAEIPLRMKQ